jgi:hypothetical protein
MIAGGLLYRSVRSADFIRKKYFFNGIWKLVMTLMEVELLLRSHLGNITSLIGKLTELLKMMSNRYQTSTLQCFYLGLFLLWGVQVLIVDVVKMLLIISKW